MKTGLILFILIAQMLVPSAWAETVATCSEVVNPNVGNAPEKIYDAGNVTLLKEAHGYRVKYDPWDLRCAINGCSILALSTGCVFTGSKKIGFQNCKETENALYMQHRWTGGDEPKALGKFDKISRQLQLTFKVQNILGVYHSRSNVLFQCK